MSSGKLARAAVVLHLESVRALAQLSLVLLCLSGSGQELLQLSLHFLPSVFGLGLCLLETLHLSAQLSVVTLQILEVLLQVSFELGQKGLPVTFLQSCEKVAAAEHQLRAWEGATGGSAPWSPSAGEEPHPLGLLQLIRQLLQRRGVSLPHVLNLRVVVSRLLIDGLLQLGHLLLSFGSAKKN